MSSVSDASVPSAAPLVEPRDWRTPVELVSLGAIWGGSFLFMRVAAKDFGPFPMVATRLLLGAAVLAPLLWRARAAIRPAHIWKMLGIGALSAAIPFTLFAWGAERAPAGIGAIANSMTVLFAALVAFVAFGEKIDTRKALALVAGFVGVVILASGRTAGDNIAPAALAGALASLCYGISANLIKRYLADLPPTAVAAGCLLGAAILTAPLALATWPSAPIPGKSWLCVIALGVMCTGLAYAFYFRLIQRIGAPRAATSTYLVPLFGVAWAWMFLGEALTPTMALAGAIILGSVIFSQKRKA
ncbi:drug/metabolite transporter (DMT)-like permease [Luteibacter rhizovicinus]|uniref:Drug/metabolite transporter (DMT)-like permease n=1 Tax=Luteibacter rhizovicinus TaxID=242606 RepID=A0A4R3YQA1_9GAMM|nr:DMT family transporter [Luteibacter rhizovicinus]TCV94571.1 drug/metabolite transporter (DMT)-like permease [Luteibacter rhizovicinus]